MKKRTYPRPMSPWTHEDDRTLSRLYADPELRLKQIAAQMGRSLSSVRNRLGRRGMANRRRCYRKTFQSHVRHYHDKGWCVAYIAYRLQCSWMTVKRALRFMNLKPNPRRRRRDAT